MALYESGFLQHIILINLLILIFVFTSYGKRFTKNSLSKKLFKYLLILFTFNIIDSLFISLILRKGPDHFYHRVDLLTPKNEDFLTFRENQNLEYCGYRMGILSNITCRPYFLVKNLTRSHKYSSPKDFNKKNHRESAQNRIDKYDKWSDETIGKCIKTKNFLEKNCIEANLFQYSRAPEKGKEITKIVLTHLGRDLKDMNCDSFFKASFGYRLHNFDLNELLLLQNIGTTNKDQWIKDLNIEKCFSDQCKEVCSEQYRYYSDSTTKDRIQKVILLSLFLERFPLHKENSFHKKRLQRVMGKLRSEGKITDFSSFNIVLNKHYPTRLIKLGLDKRKDEKLWLRIYHTN